MDRGRQRMTEAGSTCVHMSTDVRKVKHNRAHALTGGVSDALRAQTPTHAYEHISIQCRADVSPTALLGAYQDLFATRWCIEHSSAQLASSADGPAGSLWLAAGDLKDLQQQRR